MARKKVSDSFDFIGFAPDAKLDDPGACSVMNGAVPTTRGWRAAPGRDMTNRFASTFLPGGTIGGINYFPSLQLAVYNTATKIYSAQIGNTMRDVTGGVTLSPVADSWALPAANLGADIVLNAGGSNLITAVLSATFAPLTGSPHANHLVTASRFVMALGTDVSSSGWKCSARDNAKSWTLSPASLCAQGILADDNVDGITTGVAFGDEIIAFKDDRAYHGRFTPGNEEVWVWELSRFNKGALEGKTAVKYKQGIIFLSHDNLYYYDGASLIGLMDGRMAKWYSDRVVNGALLSAVVVDEIADLVYVRVLLYKNDGTNDRVRVLLVCDPKTKRWGWHTAQEVWSIGPGPAMYPASASAFTPGKALTRVWMTPNTATDAERAPRELSARATANAVSAIVTNDFGDPFADIELTRANLKFIVSPTGTAPIVTGLCRNNLDGALVTASPPIARSPDGHFDVRQQARWHQLKFDLYGDWELEGYAVDAGTSGVR